jgi:hypothetical protein
MSNNLTKEEKKNQRHRFLLEKRSRHKLQAAHKLAILCWDPLSFRPHMFNGAHTEKTHPP